MEAATLPQRLLDALERYDAPRAQLYKMGDRWESISAKELLRRVAGLSKALSELGVNSGDRVAIFSPNCPEWHIADFAIQGLGAIVVPIYFRESPKRITYILSHAEVKTIFVAGDDQAKGLEQMRDRLPAMENVIRATGAKAATSLQSSRTSSQNVLDYEALIAQAGESDIAAYRSRVTELRPDLLASIIYTSGTTGEPKGVMLTHDNFVSNGKASFERFSLGPGDLALSFLPLAHVYERLVDYGYFFSGVSIAYVPRMEDVAQALLEVRPTVAAAVPRFFEKLYANVLERGSQTEGLRRRLFDWAIRVAREAVPWRAYGRPASLGIRWRWWLADRIVYSKFRAGVGGRITKFISGGAPLAPELAEFFTTVGLPLFQGYGLTETSPVIATNVPDANRIGTVGQAIPGVEIRIADDGEILVRGPCVMKGYYRKPEETSAVISPDKWFSTGDIGRLDADGYLIITDRKKELLKTAGGKLVAPAPIENALKASPYVLNAVVVGDRRPYISALIVPNFTTVRARAGEAGLKFDSSQDLMAHPWVHDLIENEIERLTGNLAQYESIKRFALLDREFTFDGGELTFTLKLKRRVINERYAEIIDELYAKRSSARS